MKLAVTMIHIAEYRVYWWKVEKCLNASRMKQFMVVPTNLLPT